MRSRRRASCDSGAVVCVQERLCRSCSETAKADRSESWRTFPRGPRIPASLFSHATIFQPNFHTGAANGTQAAAEVLHRAHGLIKLNLNADRTRTIENWVPRARALARQRL